MAQNVKDVFKKNNIDLSHSQFILLKTVYFKEGLSQKDLSNILYKDIAAVKRTIDILEAKELVEKVRVTLCENEIKITEKGRELLPWLMEFLNEAAPRFFSGISSDKLEEIKSVLRTVQKNARG